MTLAPERTETELKEGRVVAIAGPVVDVEFPPDAIPEINTAIEMTIDLEAETSGSGAGDAKQIGKTRVRAICRRPPEGVRGGRRARTPGNGLQMRVGEGVLGHVLNVLGEPLDVAADQLTGIEDHWDIHREPPPFEELEPSREMFETGIKVIDLLEPYVRGGKIGMFGGAGVGKTIII